MADRILGPDGVIAAPYRLVDDARVATWHSQSTTERGIAVRDEAATLVGYINDGRWVADCLCGAGVSVDPDSRKAYCLGCGRRFTDIVIPDERGAIEAALSVRPRSYNRNWSPGETVDELHAENVREGVTA